MSDNPCIPSLFFSKSHTVHADLQQHENPSKLLFGHGQAQGTKALGEIQDGFCCESWFFRQSNIPVWGGGGQGEGVYGSRSPHGFLKIMT
uniref:Uncharacterized protein n=1 Tax=Eutreptiella gymnastica TaxID=73025 RepID=A0A7S4LCA8_9EUGL